MARLDISKTLTVVVAAVLIVLGVAVLAGWITIQRGPAVRILFGVVLLLYAAYRLVLLRMRPRNRRRGGSGTAFLLILALVASGCRSQRKTVEEETPTQGTLRILVSESHAGLIRAEAQRFMTLYPKARITVVPVQTREAIVHFLNDSVRAVAVDRPFNAEEKKVTALLTTRCDSVMLARDALAFVVNLFNGVETVSRETASAILGGKLRDWSGIPGSGLSGPIRIVATGVNSGAYELAVGSFGLAPEGFKPHVTVATQNDVIRFVAAHREAIGFVSLACLKDTSEAAIEKEKVRALDFTAPDSTGRAVRIRLHQANVYLAKYPLYTPVILYVHSASSKLAVGFSGFVADNAGQQIVLDRGLVPATIPVRLIQLTE
jgi:phosphate transport system substrate-binding protein